MGISRLATPSTLTSLDGKTTLHAFIGNLAALGYNTDDLPEKSLQALADASFGFPQHINGYLEGAHKALLRHGHLSGAALDDALKHGHNRRVDYCNMRLAAGGRRKPMLALSPITTCRFAAA